MNGTTSITNAGEDRLVEYVASARKRLVYVAPGVSERVAEALTQNWQLLGRNAVTVILDADPEVCRLGLGTLEGLKRLQGAAVELGALVCHQPGLRIGLVISDNRTLIFSPTPLLIEAGSDAPERPNAIELASPPQALAEDVGLGSHAARQIGLDPVTPDRITEVEADLQAAPPVKFDLARRVRVFTSRFQFVELEMTGCFISRKRVRIPSDLVGLARTQDIESRFHAHFDLVQKQRMEIEAGDRVITEHSLQRGRRDIEKRFLVSLSGFGMVVLRANKDKLTEAVEQLSKDVKAFSKGVKQQLQERIEESRETVVGALLPAVERNPPDAYTKTHGPKPPKDFLRQRLTEDVERAFGSADALVSEMKVALVFKDVAYESLVDGKFLETARKAMPGIAFLHEEYEAAPAAEQRHRR